MGGMGSITQAMAKGAQAFGAEIRTNSAVQQIDSRDGRVRSVVLEDGTEIRARVVLSNADPKRTFLGLVPERDLPADFGDPLADAFSLTAAGDAEEQAAALAGQACFRAGLSKNTCAASR